MILPTVKWYHAAMLHAEGMERLEQTIRRHFFHPRLRETVREVVRSCEVCQKMKRDSSTQQYGELAPREVSAIPWQTIMVDTIGPWSIRLHGQTIKYIALTTIDPVTNLLEIQRMPNKTAEAAKRAFELSWLCRYPRPLTCVHDNGPEFSGHDFQFMLEYAGIKSSPVTMINPQSNGIIERIHATVGLVLRTMVHARRVNNQAEADQLVEDSIAQTILAARSISHGALNHLSPGTVVFGRDMLLDLPFVADILALRDLRQRQVDQRLLEANRKRRQRDWQVNEEVLLRNPITAGDKLKPTYKGPFRIIRIHTNANVTLQHPNGVQERVNIQELAKRSQFQRNFQDRKIVTT